MANYTDVLLSITTDVYLYAKPDNHDHDVKWTNKLSVNIELRQLAKPWAKSWGIYGISILFSIPTAWLVGALFVALDDPITARFPDELRITFVIALAALTLVSAAVALSVGVLSVQKRCGTIRTCPRLG